MVFLVTIIFGAMFVSVWLFVLHLWRWRSRKDSELPEIKHQFEKKELFRVDLALQAELNNDGEISEQLRQAFVENGLSLSPNATILTKKNDRRWLITSTGYPQTYLIRKKQGKLHIYQSIDLSYRQPWRSRTAGILLKLLGLIFMLFFCTKALPLVLTQISEPAGWVDSWAVWLVLFIVSGMDLTGGIPLLGGGAGIAFIAGIIAVYIGYRISLVPPAGWDKKAQEKPVDYFRTFEAVAEDSSRPLIVTAFSLGTEWQQVSKEIFGWIALFYLGYRTGMINPVNRGKSNIAASRGMIFIRFVKYRFCY